MVRKRSYFPVMAILGAAVIFVWLRPAAPRAGAAFIENTAKSIHLALQPVHVFAQEEDDDADHDMTFKNQETIQKSFSMPASEHRSLEIDNVFGSIEVIGGSSDQVEMVVNRTNRAETKDKLEKAHKEVTLDVTQEAGNLKLYVNGPFRCHCPDCGGCNDNDPGYIVTMNFQVHVPRDIEVKVKTVNDGHVVVSNTNGNFYVRNVNGDIKMENVAGSGTARTVNGPVKISFRQNPRENSDFKTVNGDIDLKFAHDLAADFRFKTFNGEVYSDFPVTALPAHSVQEEHHDGKLILRADRATSARVSGGGPEIKIENLNGDIRILENHE
jgi:DUF4097 and DUF4098 domain-containing protein YvlB